MNNSMQSVYRWATIVVSFCVLLSAQASAGNDPGTLHLTEAQLKQYDGFDAGKPIYLAINGAIFDVSASPSFYGPGGHYHQFTGKDASRAWVSECWDREDQLTSRMDGLEAMYMPKYLDEQMQQAAGGKADFECAAEYGQGELARMAKVMMGKFGEVSEQEVLKRRSADREAALQGAQDRLAHWFNFFASNEKYKIVGNIIFDEDKPEPSELCEEALKKRPLKGGILDSVMKGGLGMDSLLGSKRSPAGTRNEL